MTEPIAGPSSQPYTSNTKQSHSSINNPTATTTTSTATPTIPRSVNGPIIIPTILHADGIKEVPHFFELCQIDDLIVLIASMLDRLIAHNDRIPLTPTSLTRFHSRAPPTINIVDYLTRIERYTNVEAAVLLILLPYVDKVCSRWTTFTVNSLSVHRFVIAGVSVGSKALSDSFCTNGRYARVGGVSLAEMCLLEKEFCEAIDWRLTTTGAVLAHYYSSLVRSHPLYRLPPGEVPIPSNIHPLDHVPFTSSLDSLPNSSNSSKRSSMIVTDTDGDADAEMEESDDLSSIVASTSSTNGSDIKISGMEIDPPLPTPPEVQLRSSVSSSSTSTSSNSNSHPQPHSHTSTTHPPLNNNTNGFSHKGKSTTALTPPREETFPHHKLHSPPNNNNSKSSLPASSSTSSSNYFPITANSKSSNSPPSTSTDSNTTKLLIDDRGRTAPALIPPKNLSSNRLVSASNLPSPVRSSREGGVGSVEAVDDLGIEVKRRLLTKTSPISNNSGSTLSSPTSSTTSTTGASPRIVEIGRE